MFIELISVYSDLRATQVLFDLLAEREASQSISHKAMPSWEAHCAFVNSRPYAGWYLIKNSDKEIVGSAYLTHAREIGVSVFHGHRRQRYARAAIKALIALHPGDHFFANINPRNVASINLFEGGLGFRHIQNTYRFDLGGA